MLAGSIVGSGICLLLAVVTEGLFSAQGVCLLPRQTCGGTTDGLANSHLGCGVQGSVLVCTKGGKQNTFSDLSNNRRAAQFQAVPSS